MLNFVVRVSVIYVNVSRKCFCARKEKNVLRFFWIYITRFYDEYIFINNVIPLEIHNLLKHVLLSKYLVPYNIKQQKSKSPEIHTLIIVCHFMALIKLGMLGRTRKFLYAAFSYRHNMS